MSFWQHAAGINLQAITEEIRTRGGKADHFVVDLTDEAATDNLINEIKQKYPRLDVLINNAGTGWYGYFEQLPWQCARDMIDLNMTVLVKLTRAFIPQMRLRNSGHIINISSIVGDLPAQGAVLYSSTKAFVNSFTKAISRELNGSGVKVSLVKPGPVSTGFYSHAEGDQWAAHSGRKVRDLCRESCTNNCKYRRPPTQGDLCARVLFFYAMDRSIIWTDHSTAWSDNCLAM